MSVNDWVTRVVDVLARAESLFAGVDGSADTSAGAAGIGTGDLAAAAEANHELAASTVELSGSGVSSHQEAARASASALGAAADTEAALAEQLNGAAGIHSDGAGQAAHLRGSAAAIAEAVAPLRDNPAADMVVLKTLRAQLADMQELMAMHAGHGAAIAEEIRGLGYNR